MKVHRISHTFWRFPAPEMTPFGRFRPLISYMNISILYIDDFGGFHAISIHSIL